MSDWHVVAIRCPHCLSRSTWCAPGETDAARGLEYICLGCDGRFYRKGRSFVGYSPYKMLSEWDQQRVRELRRIAGCGGNSAVGAFG